MDRNPRWSARWAAPNEYGRSRQKNAPATANVRASVVRRNRKLQKNSAWQVWRRGAKFCRILGLCGYAKKNPPNVQNAAPRMLRPVSAGRRKPIPSGRKGIIEIYAKFLPPFFNLQRSGQRQKTG